MRGDMTMEKDKEQKLFRNVKPLAIYMDTTEWSIRNLLRKGMVPYIKIGRRIFFDKDEIDAWIKRNSQPDMK